MRTSSAPPPSVASRCATGVVKAATFEGMTPEDRLALCLQAVEGGRRTALEVVGELSWTRRRRSLEELDVFNSALAVLETVAYLELLTARAELLRSEDGHREYQVA